MYRSENIFTFGLTPDSYERAWRLLAYTPSSDFYSIVHDNYARHEENIIRAYALLMLVYENRDLRHIDYTVSDREDL